MNMCHILMLEIIFMTSETTKNITLVYFFYVQDSSKNYSLKLSPANRTKKNTFSKSNKKTKTAAERCSNKRSALKPFIGNLMDKLLDVQDTFEKRLCRITNLVFQEPLRLHYSSSVLK